MKLSKYLPIGSLEHFCKEGWTENIKRLVGEQGREYREVRKRNVKIALAHLAYAVLGPALIAGLVLKFCPNINYEKRETQEQRIASSELESNNLEKSVKNYDIMNLA